MPEIFTKEWADALFEQARKNEVLLKKAPLGEWRIAFEVEGDGKSPYVPQDVTKHYFVRLLDNELVEYREVPEKISGKELQYRFIASASVFESVASGLLDPVEAGLSGVITIRGDMRILLQHTEIVDVIYGVYLENNPTEWTKGKPPYE